jgi:ATP-dependent Clp protease protease subunit
MKDDNSFGADDIIKLSLLENSVFFLNGEIAEENIGECIKWLTYENLEKDIKTLTIYVNSYGGDIYQAFALIDAIRLNKHNIKIVATGAAMSAAFLILSAGTPGHRYATQHTGLMSHQFSSESESLKYHDLKSTMKELDWINERMYNILKSTTGLDGRTVKRKLLAESDVYFKAEDLLKYGVIDHVI